MAAVARRPLYPRVDIPTIAPALAAKSPTLTRKALGGISNLKRPRSPEPHATRAAGETSLKRPKASASSKEKEKEKEPLERTRERRATRAVQDDEFKAKYTKAFPSWTFYFDVSDHERSDLQQRVLSLAGTVTDFFSNEVTHFISNKPVPPAEGESNKENAVTKVKALLRSPIKLGGRGGGTGTEDALMRKAVHLGMKIWDTKKLSSVLTRCGFPAQNDLHANQPPTRSLTSLLESEKRFGTTTERDPTQRRHDYRYFAKNSCFVLVEDITQEHATIAAMEYPFTGRSADGKGEGDWPVPYCHPFSRGPFIRYDEKEERVRAKQEKLDKGREAERAAEAKRIRLKRARQQQKAADLRRTVSMNNLHKATAEDPANDTIDGSKIDGSAAGLPAPSGYLAASGNSVGITSTYGTTSTVGSSTMLAYGNVSQAPVSIRNHLKNQVTWSRRAAGADGRLMSTSKETDSKESGSREKASASSAMPPPDAFPARVGRLRKSKSTNTVRLPKRDEATKPGYCESCRMKFDDFKEHIQCRKHRKFAQNDGNFAELDCVLARVRRQTREEIEEIERRKRETREFEEQLRRRETFFADDDDNMGRYDDDGQSHDGDVVDESEEDEDEILLSPRKKRGGVREDWDDDPME